MEAHVAAVTLQGAAAIPQSWATFGSVHDWASAVWAQFDGRDASQSCAAADDERHAMAAAATFALKSFLNAAHFAATAENTGQFVLGATMVEQSGTAAAPLSRQAAGAAAGAAPGAAVGEAG